jgi:rhodanese-related sulfurtransferase
MSAAPSFARLIAALGLLAATPVFAQSSSSGIEHATLGEQNAKSAEVSTHELQSLLRTGGVVLLDTRPHLEWAMSHIPGALNVAPKRGVPMSQYVSDVAEIERLTGGDRTRAMVLYCNGPFCGKSKRLSEELLAAGFKDVRRYQLGAPVWRALGGLMEIELDAVRQVHANDGTAVFIDVRDSSEFERGSVRRAVNLQRAKVLKGKDIGEVKAAKDDGRLPMEDHNTRIVIFGRDVEQARAVAEAVCREAFHNVTYFRGTAAELMAALK